MVNKRRTVITENTFRPIEELNLIDNFLFHTVVTQGEDGEEFCRIILSTILGKTIRKVRVIAQQSIPGLDTDMHGIRMDAYVEDVSDGVDYDKLPRVVIIVILPYDPFGQNRMVYTIKNQCEEDPAIPYEDGARKIFLYTKGTEGNPSQSLRDMLKYMEDTKRENVTNEDISRIHEFVEKAKHRKEVGIGYMNLWEEKLMMAKEARETGYAEGSETGYAEGHETGYAEGREAGLEAGLKEGKETGREAGREEGREEMYGAFIKMCQEFQMSKSAAMRKLQENTNLNEEEAAKYIEKYWR